MRVEVRGEVLRWARERAGFTSQVLHRRFPKIDDWEQDSGKPTLKQLENFAKATMTPIGFLFLSKPPVERIPLPDFRARRTIRNIKPSPNLLDTIYLCQQRQEWYREFARSEGELTRKYVGSARLTDSIDKIAEEMRHELRFDLDARRDCPTWTDALRMFIKQTDDLGILVMASGVVLSNNRRKLNPNEFRGFAISDDLAPLIFVNAADTKAAQMFTLAHELAHLWLGKSALSDIDPAEPSEHEEENWCNRVAAEFLVPIRVLRTELLESSHVESEIPRLARRFKVSTLVILRRMFDARIISKAAFEEAYQKEQKRFLAMGKSSGGDFYLTLAARVSRRFAGAVVARTLEGQTLYRDAYRMLGISKAATFRELGRSLEFTL